MKIQSSILKVLVYFDVFRYPLTSKEIMSFLDQPANEHEFNIAIEDLLGSKKIFLLDEFYSLQNDLSLSTRRKKGNEYAAFLLKKAEPIASRLYKFPYVRGVGISGSVSKKFADEDADIDYFIITKADRLWIARTFLHLFKKIPQVKNRHQHYCMNYFIDEAELVIEEKNIYTATELFTLIPMEGNGSIKKFFETNSWSYHYFPNKSLPTVKSGIKKHNWWLKSLAEFVFNTKLGNRLDDYLMRWTTRRWKKKEEQQRLNTKGERMGLKTGKHFSKPGSIFFHDWFMTTYREKLEKVLEEKEA